MAIPLQDAFQDEAERCRDAGLTLEFWWRDDDLVAETPNLHRLSQVAAQAGVDCLTSVIPALCDVGLARLLDRLPGLVFAQHGYRHQNHQPAGAPKNEFGANRPYDVVRQELAEGWDKLQGLFGERLLPVFVGPWNRCAPQFGPLLVDLGFVGWSGFGNEPVRPAEPRLVSVDAHLDIIRWSANPGLQDPEALMTQFIHLIADARLAAADAEADAPRLLPPLGLLTHHRVMDEEAWAFVVGLIDLAIASGGAWRGPRPLFGL